MSAALRRYRAAVELEAARGNLRLATVCRRQTHTDFTRVQAAEAAWNRLGGDR